MKKIEEIFVVLENRPSTLGELCRHLVKNGINIEAIGVFHDSAKLSVNNPAKAMKVLRARLLDTMIREQNAKRSEERKSQVGSGDRSERIRTYNFPQGRVTDHRIGLTLYKLESILQGDINELIEGLITFYQARALKHEESRDPQQQSMDHS